MFSRGKYRSGDHVHTRGWPLQSAAAGEEFAVQGSDSETTGRTPPAHATTRAPPRARACGVLTARAAP